MIKIRFISGFELDLNLTKNQFDNYSILDLKQMIFEQNQLWTDNSEELFNKFRIIFEFLFLVLGLLFLTFFNHPTPNKIGACLLLFMYTFYILYYTNDLILHVSEKKHLQYKAR
jgi:hypothetical protein